MAYPNTFDEFRETENRADVVYDPDQKKRVFAEDINNTTAALAAVQAVLGLNPDAGWGTVVDYCQAINQLATDAYDYAEQAYSLADDHQGSIDDLYNWVYDLDGRVSNLGG